MLKGQSNIQCDAQRKVVENGVKIYKFELIP